MRSIVWLLIPLAGCIGSLAYAAIQTRESARLATDLRTRNGELEQMLQMLEQSGPLLAQSADLLPAIAPQETDLKDIVSREAYQLGMTVSDMTPSQEENDRGELEDRLRVVLRRPGHGQLVRFLTALENQARWALVSSIHMEVRDDSDDRYDEVVVILSVPSSGP